VTSRQAFDIFAQTSLEVFIRKGARMRAILLVAGTVLLAAVQIGSAAAPKEQVARGSYLVSQVAMCVQCHTPRDADGNLDRARLLKGAPMPVRSPFANQTWAFAAPAVAGLPGWTTEDALSLLTAGRRLSGYTPKRPMPPFRLIREDAEAVVAYLHSLR
jgi:mono/diheme cytochrome c family protein